MALSFDGSKNVKIKTDSAFAFKLKSFAGIKRIVILADDLSLVEEGLLCAREILVKADKVVTDAELNDTFLGSHEIHHIDGQPYSKWIPPQWWPQTPTAIFLGCPKPGLDERLLRCLCKYAVLDDSQANDRKSLPHDKLPDGSFFILGDNKDMAFSKKILEISDYVRGEILKLNSPFTEWIENTI
jgi:hypothetical protein